MSVKQRTRWKEYPVAIVALAAEQFEKYNTAKARLEKAKEKHELCRTFKQGDYRAAARAASAEAEYLDAKDEFQRAEREFRESSGKIEKLRGQLAAVLDEDNAADPGELDENTLTLLKSGILKPAEYRRLYDQASEAENKTMMRIIAGAADQARAEAEKSPLTKDDRTLSELRNVVHDCREANNKEMAIFDGLSDIYRRTANNPAMMKYWPELTADYAAELDISED